MLKLNHELLKIATILLVVPSLVYCYNDNISDELTNNNNNFSQTVETTASADSFSTLALPISQQQIIINPYNESEPSESVNLTVPAPGTTAALNNFSTSVYDYVTATGSSIPMTTTTSTTATTPSTTNSLKAIGQNEYAQYADDTYDAGRESGARFFPDGLTDFVQQPPAISGYDVFNPPEPTAPSSPFLYDPDTGYYTTNEFAPQPNGAGDYVQPTVDTDDDLLPSLPIPVPIAPSLVQPAVYTDEPGASSLGTTPSVPTPRSTKQSKQILTYKSNADKVLRDFVNDSYLRSPTAILIDTSGKAHDRAQMMWRATLLPNKSTLPNAALDMVLVTFNSSGECFPFQ
jgi:hypothetical protein